MGGAYQKPVVWIGSTRKDISDLPDDVKSVLGYAIYLAQIGKTHQDAKPMKRMGGGVLEVVENDDGKTYRAVYTVRFDKAVYVLDVFQKKSTIGIKTQPHIVNRIKDRLKKAEQHHKETYERKDKGQRK